MEMNMTLTTTSIPLVSRPLLFQLHIQSFSLFQNAPDAECIPLLVAAPPLAECWMIVLFTANLYCEAFSPAAVVSTRFRRMWSCA